MELLLALLIQGVSTQRIITIVVLVILGALVVFFFYSIAVLLLYWVILLLPMLLLVAGVYLRTQDPMTGNVVIGIAAVWGVIWYVLAFSKRSNFLRRILKSLDRSLP